MLLITCPYCGPRDEIEFAWGGDAEARRPELSCTDEQWGAYLFQRRNTKGVNDERWVHAAGCRQWFRVRRDSTTHEILETGMFGEAAPATADGRVAP